LRRSEDDAEAADGASVGAPAGSANGSADPSAQAGRGHTAGKGRPTPKRRDAETKRRGPAPPPPKTQRESMRLARANRAARKERRGDRASRMAAGDQKALPARDRGPVKAYVRDLIDCRRHLIGFFMPLALLVFAGLIVPLPRIQSMISLFVMAMMAAMVLEGLLIGRRVTRAAREKFPKEQISAPALTWYAFSRASQIRRLRVPKARVAIGDKVDGAA
jgi:hypothetical protein